MLSVPSERAEEAESVHLEVIRAAIREAVDEMAPPLGRDSTAAGAGAAAEDAVAQWTQEEDRHMARHMAQTSVVLRHWALGVQARAFHIWVSRTDPRARESASARQAVSLGGGGMIGGWLHDDEAVLERPSVAMLDGPGHYVRAGYLPEQARLSGARVRGRKAAAMRGVHDGPLALGRQHDARMHSLVSPPSAFPANSGFSGLPGPPWGAPNWATQPECGAPVHHSIQQQLWGAAPYQFQYPMPVTAWPPAAMPVAVQPAAAPAAEPASRDENGVAELRVHTHRPLQLDFWGRP